MASTVPGTGESGHRLSAHGLVSKQGARHTDGRTSVTVAGWRVLLEVGTWRPTEEGLQLQSQKLGEFLRAVATMLDGDEKQEWSLVKEA